MRESASFTRLWPSLLILIGAAYAVWVGFGAVGNLVYGEAAGLACMFFIGLLIASIIGLKLVSD
ncbi:MAG: hypothetical protein WD969_16795 [Paracoccaceae bacterium]